MVEAEREILLFSKNVLTENGSKKNILMVDDQDANHIILNYYLAGECNIKSAVNGWEAMELLSTRQYHGVILDIDLGQGPDGFDVLEFIRTHVKTKHLPVMACTSFASSYNTGSYVRAGFNAVLGKPFSRADLIHRLNNLFQN